MAPKQKKAPAKKPKGAEAAGGGKNAECGLTRAPFEEESWQVCVSMIVGSGPDEEDWSRCLLSAVQQPIRAHFTLLTWDGVLEKLCEFNPKAKKVETLPPFYEHAAVAEAAKGLLDAGQEIPCDLLAKVVKCLLLQVKRVDQQRRDEQCPDSKGEEDGVDAERTEKKGKLKRRGEVEIPTILDQPEDGPQLYILLFGFYHALLIAALDDVGVHVATVVRLCSEGRDQEERSEDDASRAAETNVDLARKLSLFWSELAPVLNSGSGNSRLPDVVQLSYTVRIPSPEARLETGIRIYGGVANLLYDCLVKRRQHQHYLKSMRLINVPAVARLPPQQAEVLPLTTARSKKKGDVEEPAPKPKTEPQFLSADVDMRYYWNLIDRIPSESCSVPLILHCMLEQVVVSTEEPSSAPVSPPDSPWFDDPVISFLLQRFLPQARSEEEQRSIQKRLLPGLSAAEKKRLRQKFGAKTAQKKNSRQPLLIRQHDEAARRFLDISATEDFDPEQVEQAMARLHPACSLIQFRGQRGESAPCWRSIRQHLQHFCTDDAASWREVERFFHQSVFESMPLTRLNRDGVLERSATLLGALEPAQQHTVLPWDDPPSFASLQLKNKQTPGQTFATEDPDNAEVGRGTGPRLELAHIQSCRLRSLSDRRFSEHHDAAVFSQVLQSVWDRFCCVDVFTGRLNNMVYMFCHNPTGPSRHSREFWDAGLHTDVRFRNYLEYVAESVSDWTREEELKREAAKAQSAAPAERPEDLQTQLEEGPVIREGSLKAWKLEQERLKEEEEEEEKNKTTKNQPKGKQQQEAAKPGDAKKKKGAGNVESVPEPSVEESAEAQPEEAFVGLSTGGMLIHVSGRVQHLRPSDGGAVTVEDIRYAEASQLLKVVVEKDGHRFCTHVHHHAADRLKPESPEHQSGEPLTRRGGRQGSFTALLHSGARMSYSFYGPTGEAPGDVLETPETADHPPSGKTPGPPSSETPRAPESQGFPNLETFRSLVLSVPSGLLVQFQRELAEGASWQEQGLSVKQCFPLCGAEGAQLPDLFLSEETFRTVTSAGDVMRHLRDGATQLLFADGTVSFSSFSAPDSEAAKRAEEAAQKAGEKAAPKRSWITMTPAGERFHTVGNTHKRLPVTDLLVVKATDPMSDDVMLTREDRVVLVQRSDGSQAVEHADGTRISSWFQDRPAKVAASADAEETPPTSTPPTSAPPTSAPPTSGREEAAPGPTHDGKAQRDRERVVSVEKEGCATVVMFPERRAAQVHLADGTVVTATNQGTYEVRLSNAGSLKIDGGGTCTYVPGRPRPAGGAAPVYRMSHTARVACDITDPEGNHFQVLEDGGSSVSLGSFRQEEKPHQEDLPRLFLVHGDGSAVELLSAQTVEEVLRQACSDPAAALLKEPLPDCPDEFAVTVLKPGHRSLWSRWIMGKRAPDITPQNLRNRSWAHFPQTEKKTPGPQFGSTFGKEMFGGSGSQHQPVRSCPEVLELRQLYEHRPLSAAVAEAVDARLKDYMEALLSREQQLEGMEVEEPRAELHIPALARTTSDLVARYERWRGAPAAQNLSLDASSRDSSAANRKSRWSERLRRHRQELREEKTLRAALRTRSCLPYFHLENLPLYQKVVQLPKADPWRASGVPSPVLRSDASDDDLPETAPPQNSPPPVNPTPPQSVSRAAGSDSKVERSLSDVATQTSVGGALKVSTRHYKSVYADVTGEPRKAKVRLPASVLSSGVRSVPNPKFLSVEGPLRRRCRFMSLSDPQVPPRGFQLVPSRVDFGSLPDGGSASATVRMKNVGVDSCRFHVKQPPLRTGVRVLYTPGPVPAGLHVDLQVQLLATAAGESKEPQTRIHQDLVIQTELETLYLPVTATVLLRGDVSPPQ